jgi:hypothetical protein
VFLRSMSNVLADDKHHQILALGRLGWSLRRIERTTGVRRETISGYLVRLLDPKTGQLLREHLRAPRGWHRIADVDRPRRTPSKTVALSKQRCGSGWRSAPFAITSTGTKAKPASGA